MNKKIAQLSLGDLAIKVHPLHSSADMPYGVHQYISFPLSESASAEHLEV